MKNETDNEKVFENVYLLVEHLEKQGFKISKSKAYRDKRAGILRVEPDGVVLANNARAYAMTLRKVGVSPINLEKINEEKSKKEVERLSLEIEKIKFNLDRERGKYLLKEEFEMEMAARASVFDLSLRHMVHTRVPEWIKVTGGSDEKTNLLIELMNKEIDDLLNSYAAMDRFQVVFVGDFSKKPEVYGE